jgi:hypothetical protein
MIKTHSNKNYSLLKECQLSLSVIIKKVRFILFSYQQMAPMFLSYLSSTDIQGRMLLLSVA